MGFFYVLTQILQIQQYAVNSSLWLRGTPTNHAAITKPLEARQPYTSATPPEMSVDWQTLQCQKLTQLIRFNNHAGFFCLHSTHKGQLSPRAQASPLRTSPVMATSSPVSHSSAASVPADVSVKSRSSTMTTASGISRGSPQSVNHGSPVTIRRVLHGVGNVHNLRQQLVPTPHMIFMMFQQGSNFQQSQQIGAQTNGRVTTTNTHLF